MAEAAPPVPTCLNCGYLFRPERLNYCPMCGQETALRPPTIREFAQQFGGSYIAVEGALWRSLKLLLLKPGQLTRDYLDGRRRQYVLPLRLYLTVSLIALLLFKLLAMANLERLQAAHGSEPPRYMAIGFGFGYAERRDGVFTCTNLPQWTCERLRKRLEVDPKLFVQETKQYLENLLGRLGAAMFVLLPLFTLWLRLLYRNRGMNYTEHLVFALHVHAFWFAMLCFMAVGPAWLTMLAGVIALGYMLLAMRCVYGGRWVPRLLRAGALSVLYALTLAPTLMVLVAVAVLF